MIVYHNNISFEINKSIIVAGVRASGKSYLIRLLKTVITAPLIHRPVVESKGFAEAGTIIHWPIAEKFPNLLRLDNVGLVLMLNKDWDSYCFNVEERRHATQYTKLGLQDIHSQWFNYFSSKKISIFEITKNDYNLPNLIHDIAEQINKLNHTHI